MTEKDEYTIKITKEEKSILIAGMGAIADSYLTIASKQLYSEKRRNWLELNDKIVLAEKTMEF